MKYFISLPNGLLKYQILNYKSKYNSYLSHSRIYVVNMGPINDNRWSSSPRDTCADYYLPEVIRCRKDKRLGRGHQQYLSIANLRNMSVLYNPVYTIIICKLIASYREFSTHMQDLQKLLYSSGS